MKTLPNKGGSSEMQRKHESPRRYPTYTQHNRNYYNYSGNNSKGYHNRYSGTMRPSNCANYNRSRDKSVKYNVSKVPNSIHVKPQTTPQCVQEAAPWSQEALERERQQQLSDTANKLLNKLKVWNTEKSGGEDPEGSHNEGHKRVSPPKVNEMEKVRSKQGRQSQNDETGIVNEKQGKKTHKANIEKERMERKMRGEVISTQNLQWKNKSQGISEKKQRKIQQNIIGELMAMPKENLNKVLINPKIHPKIEKKMAQIVKENRLILAQKFRHLAESKMNGQGHFQFQSKFVNDVENLIDPDLAIDLCQLPPEFIKQMGDIFQLDFDSCLKNAETQEESKSCNVTYEYNTDETMDYSDSCINSYIGMSESNRGNDFEKINIKLENQPAHEALGIEEQKIGKIYVRDFANYCNESRVKIDQPSVVVSSKMNSMSQGEFPLARSEMLLNTEKSSARINETPQIGEQCKNHLYSESVIKNFQSHKTLDNSVQNLTATPECDSRRRKSQQKIKQEKQEGSMSWGQSDESHIFEESNETKPRPDDDNSIISNSLRNSQCFEKKSCEVQTIISIKEVNRSTQIEKEIEEDMVRSELMEELDKIDKLIHVLNQRRFFLFLKLVNLKNCNTTNGLKNKLLQCITYNDKSVVKKVRGVAKRNWKNKSKRLKKNLDAMVHKGPLIKSETFNDVIFIDC